MPAKCLIISNKPQDLELGKHLAATQQFEFHTSKLPKEIKSYLVDHPQTIVLWDGDDRVGAEVISQALIGTVAPIRVFVVTENPLNTYPYLFKFPSFAHHLLRRYDDPTPTIFQKLANAALSPHPFGIANYFPAGSASQKITIKRSGQKPAAVEAIQNYFTKQNLGSRLAALVARSTDELIMNAIFDAPINQAGENYRRATPREADFDLNEKETVELTVVSNEKYTGVSVSDSFGSLKKDIVMSFLRKDYQDEAYIIRRGDPGAGLGLNGTIQAGLSMLFVCKPKVRTEVMLFFPNTQSYKDFREGFRFVSIMSE
jgi:hypothetical protein